MSTLLGAVYLSPLDEAMHKLYKKGHIFYLRYVDDIVVLAKTRHNLRSAMKLLYKTLDQLKLKIHKDEKFFVGKSSKGFSFLGYYFKPNRKPRPSRECLGRFIRNVKRLKEQILSEFIQAGRDVLVLLDSDNKKSPYATLINYIRRFYSYLRAGLGGAALNQGLRRLAKFIDSRDQAFLNGIAQASPPKIAGSSRHLAWGVI